MEKLSQLVTSKKEIVNSNYLTSNKLTSLEIKFRVLEILGDLASTEPPHDMTAWYCKAYKTLGEPRMVTIAKAANEPSVKDPKRLLGWLIKQELMAKGN